MSVFILCFFCFQSYLFNLTSKRGKIQILGELFSVPETLALSLAALVKCWVKASLPSAIFAPPQPREAGRRGAGAGASDQAPATRAGPARCWPRAGGADTATWPPCAPACGPCTHVPGPLASSPCPCTHVHGPCPPVYGPCTPVYGPCSSFLCPYSSQQRTCTPAGPPWPESPWPPEGAAGCAWPPG